jgi:hypothetical protein
MPAMRFEQGVAFPFSHRQEETGIKGGRILCFRKKTGRVRLRGGQIRKSGNQRAKENAKSYN